jgi:molecular chaperone IbpA
MAIPMYPKDPQWPHKGDYLTKAPVSAPLVVSLPNLFSDQFFLGFQEQINRWSPLTSNKKPAAFPPYNIIKTDDGYKVELAVAGFSKDDISITVEKDLLTVKSKVKEVEDVDDNVVHRGIAERQWTQQFVLGEFMVVNSAVLKDGLLTVNVDRVVPDELKPKEIKIK